MKITGRVLKALKSNIDTDQIIPARHLTGISKTGLGKFLFEDLPSNPLDAFDHENARFILTLDNFGCGSSREHAVWSIKDRGFEVVIAVSFARIFEDNCYNNGVVPVKLSEEEVQEIDQSLTKPEHEISIDVEKQELYVADKTYNFELDQLKKEFILKGGFMKFLDAKVPEIKKWAEANI